MLVLKNVVKSYVVAGQPFPALRGVDLSFRNNEFVSILGPSGCGKTTMMNIIGGLDRYTSGDLLVDGKSTKNFTEAEWDSYRNATIGFVFQTYNLISHLSVVDNVEMSLRLSGVSAKERRQRSLEVLKEVGLSDHVYKRPNQLSGGQMQRVAIARALVNNPKILLADEPTGALDSSTSKQIIDLMKKVSKGRLVIMVTHNADLATEHSDRIVKLLDGRVVEDSRPEILETESTGKLMTKRTTMNFATALKTSFNNLLTKKGRTLITSLAGSIGIIGIALVLSISGGMNTYVAGLQSDTLSGFPISIPSTINAFGPPAAAIDSEDDFPESTIVTGFNAGQIQTHANIITDEFVTYLSNMEASYYNAITYTRAMPMRLVSVTTGGNYRVITSTGGGFFSFSRTFYELPNNPSFILSQYDMLTGRYPIAKDEVVLIVDKQNRVDFSFFSNYGIVVGDEGLDFSDIISETGEDSAFDVKWIPNNLFFTLNDEKLVDTGKTIYDRSEPEVMYNGVGENGERAVRLKIVGALRVKPSASSELLAPGLAYTSLLTDYALNDALTSNIVEDQKAAWDDVSETGYNVNDGEPFFNTLVSTTAKQYETVLKQLGGIATPVSAQIYPSSFESKDLIKLYINRYNYNENGVSLRPDLQMIIYQDLAENITSTITNLINTIAVVLTAFASISLVVSSIMIGIITYVSVIERTKEIGIMRSLGARKKDISRIFNAETIILGFTSGILGITITIILNIPIDLVIKNLIDVNNFTSLAPAAALFLVFLSTILTLIAGLIPARIASLKDPVIALRTE